MIDSAYILKPHGGSSHITNLNLGFRITERIGYRMIKTGCVFTKLQRLVETCPIIDILHYTYATMYVATYACLSIYKLTCSFCSVYKDIIDSIVKFAYVQP